MKKAYSKVVMCKKSIKVGFSDFWAGFSEEDNIFTRILSDRYDVVVDNGSPDYLFCSTFSKKHLLYDCVKVFYTGENITPDFNLFDYAIGFDYINFDDRYYRLPLYRLYQVEEDGRQKEKEFWNKEILQKKKFCNFLYSNNSTANAFRIQLLEALDSYKHVACGGKIRNNIGGCVKNKDTWLRQFKFSIACENSSKPGYVTEKIFEALRANSIPIYWGDPLVGREFNPKRFINCHAYESLDDVVAEVRRLDNDPEAYLSMLREPWFTGDTPSLPEHEISLKKFLYHIVEQGTEASRRTIRDGFVRHYIAQQARLSESRWGPLSRFWRGWKQGIHSTLGKRDK